MIQILLGFIYIYIIHVGYPLSPGSLGMWIDPDWAPNVHQQGPEPHWILCVQRGACHGKAGHRKGGFRAGRIWGRCWVIWPGKWSGKYVDRILNHILGTIFWEPEFWCWNMTWKIGCRMWNIFSITPSPKILPIRSSGLPCKNPKKKRILSGLCWKDSIPSYPA